MPGMCGFDVIAQLPQESLPVVAFVTADDHNGVRAFDAQAIDYLLKPIDDQRFRVALDHVREHLQTRSAAAQCERLLALIADMTGSGELALDEVLSLKKDARQHKHSQL